MTITIPPYSSQTQRVICTKCLLKWCETNKLQWCQTFWLCAYIFYCNNSFIHFYGLYSESVGVCNNPAPPFFFTLCMFANFANFFVIQLKSLYITTKKSMELHNYLTRKPLYLQVLDSTSEQLWQEKKMFL